MSLRTRHTFTVTAPSAGLTGSGVEKTATQGEGTQVVGLLVPETPGAVIRAAGIETSQPYRAFVANQYAPLFEIGGQVTGAVMTSDGTTPVGGVPETLFIVSASQTYAAGQGVDHSEFLLDVEAPNQNRGDALSSFTGAISGLGGV